MVNWLYLSIAFITGIIGVCIYALSPIIIIGDATETIVFMILLALGPVCCFFTLAGVVGTR